MKDGAIVCNSGHFDVEININDLKSVAKGEPRTVREFVQEYTINPLTAPGTAKRIYLLAEGRLVNLVAAEGHPASVMDMSFATQALACEWLARMATPEGMSSQALAPGVYDVPAETEELIARTKLASMGMSIDTLTAEQKNYLASWEEGT
jgi:adenosylhomocysteinase